MAPLRPGFPDSDADTELANWNEEIGSWVSAGQLAVEQTARAIPLAGIAEMADRM